MVERERVRRRPDLGGKRWSATRAAIIGRCCTGGALAGAVGEVKPASTVGADNDCYLLSTVSRGALRSACSHRMTTVCRIPPGALALLMTLAVVGPSAAQTTWKYHAAVARVEKHAMAYDSARGLVLSFGGYFQGGYLSDTLSLWDGTRWVFPTVTAGPEARASHAMAYDGVRDRTVLFGGIGRSGLVDETWEWDGSRWLRLQPAVRPSPRHGHAMAYDAARQRVVLF